MDSGINDWQRSAIGGMLKHMAGLQTGNTVK